MKTVLPAIYLTAADYERLSGLVASFKGANAEDLEEEIGRAQIVSDTNLLNSVVTMNSTVRFRDLDTNAISEVTLVYPEDADVFAKRVSVLAPVGAALIGLQKDEVIEWPVPGGHKRKLKVESISSGLPIPT